VVGGGQGGGDRVGVAQQHPAGVGEFKPAPDPRDQG